MNTLQQNYDTTRKTLIALVEESASSYSMSAVERYEIAAEAHAKALRELLDWGLGKCLALAQTDMEREAFRCLQNRARRSEVTSMRVAELCLRLED